MCLTIKRFRGRETQITRRKNEMKILRIHSTSIIFVSCTVARVYTIKIQPARTESSSPTTTCGTTKYTRKFASRRDAATSMCSKFKLFIHRIVQVLQFIYSVLFIYLFRCLTSGPMADQFHARLPFN